MAKKLSTHSPDVWGQALLAATPDLVFLHDRRGRYLDVLTSCDDQLAMPREEFIGKAVREVLPEPVAEAYMATVRDLTEEGDVRSLNYELMIGDEVRCFEGRAALCGTDYVVLVARDFTDQRRAVEALRHSQNMLAEAQRIAGLGSWEDDRQRMVLSWSDEIYHIFGVTRDEFEPSVEVFFEFIHPEDRGSVRAAFEALLEERAPYNLTHRIVRRTGEVRWVQEQAKCFYDADGTPMRLVGTTLDVTSRVLAEKELQRANAALEQRAGQLRELGLELATVELRERQRLSAVLHDNLQQLLVAAKYHIAALDSGLTDRGLLNTAHTAEEILQTAVEECRSLTIELRPPILREGGLAHALKWLGRRMQETHGLHVNVSAEGGEEIDEASGTVIFNAVKELLLNVVKHAGVKSAAAEMRITPSNELCVVVSDEGHGFDPAATTAIQGRIGGIGLFAIRERLEALGGHFQIESALGTGSRFTLIAPLPSVPSPPARGTAQAKQANEPHRSSLRPETAARDVGKIRVLMVDDHQIVRQGLVQLLSQNPAFLIAGEAADGEEAVRLARQLQPDVVLMDVNMPGMNGVEATRAIHAEFPDRIVIGLSMYNEEHRANEMRQAGAAAYVPKTVAAETLIATILSCCRAAGVSDLTR